MQTLANKYLNNIARLVLFYGYGTEPTAKLLEDSLQRGQAWMNDLARRDIERKTDYQQKYMELLEKMATQNMRSVQE